MSIWFSQPTLEICKKMNEGLKQNGSLMKTLGIEIHEIGDSFITAKMEAKPHIHNPLGIVHGGANLALAETVASYAANFAIDFERFYCVGQEISASHLKPARKGLLIATTTPLHIGKRSSVWHIEVCNNRKEVTCIARMTAAVIDRSTQKPPVIPVEIERSY